MALVVKHSSALLDPENLKLKVLLYGMNGSGKTSWMATAPNVGVGVSETGHGKGLLSVASRNLDYVELNSYDDFDAFCSGAVFKDKQSIGLDSFSECFKTFIRTKALSFPNTRGDTARRQAGIPEMQDWGVMAELGRKLLRKLLDIDKHIIVTCGLRIDKPDMESGQGEAITGPDVAGQLFMGCTAMFDLVLCLRTRGMLRDPKDAKSRYTERYFLTESPGNGIIAKNRLSIADGKSFLPSELVFDPTRNLGTFEYILKLAQDKYAGHLAAKPAA